MFRYNLKLYPAAIKKRGGLTLETTIDDLESIVEKFNEASSKVENKKRIITISAIGDTIELSLASESYLEYPVRSIRLFISMVSKLPSYSTLVTESGRLFVGESTELDVIEENVIDNREEVQLSDEELMLELVKLFNRKTSTNKVKIERIREIMEERE